MGVSRQRPSTADIGDIPQRHTHHFASVGPTSGHRHSDACYLDDANEAEPSEDLEVPGIRAINAFFRKRPASAPLPGHRGGRGGQEAPRCHFHDFADLLVAVVGDKGLLNPTAPPPLVRPIVSQMDRRRRSLAGRRHLSRSRPGLVAPVARDKVHQADKAADKASGYHFQNLQARLPRGRGGYNPIHQSIVFSRPMSASSQR